MAPESSLKYPANRLWLFISILHPFCSENICKVGYFTASACKAQPLSGSFRGPSLHPHDIIVRLMGM
ncbi:hypothetical protein PAXRUDRAFT_536284 [Paxillus rubicundulus Ve08.2h10]|uniref:Uncharacterized protein n=1 Tax=Paxillus rubicundulus Ve08.2h10 TaxID=930991 RepID=A0A0D0E627_9AGAM|nr:hypothetical protein PAXRUDRAFT_536284 [Paxillus rubicundulus Ve08.2h10]